MDYEAHKLPPVPGERASPDNGTPPPPSPQRMDFLNGRNDIHSHYADAFGADDPYVDNASPSGVSAGSLTETIIQSARESYPPPPRADGNQPGEPLDQEGESIDFSRNWAMLVGQGPTHVESVAEKDALAREAITDALVGLLRNRFTTEPLTIGLFGEWGSGKSSQVGFVKKRLGKRIAGHPYIRVIEFNAWEHEKCDNLSAALAQTVVEQLIQDTSLMKQWKLARKLAARKREHIAKAAEKDWIGFQAKLYQWVMPFISFELASALMIVLLVLQADWDWWVKLAASAPAVLLSGWKVVDKYVSKNLTNWFKRIAGGTGGGPFGLPDYAEKLGTFHAIRQTLQHLVSLQIEGGEDASKGEYLLIVVDDLDRCSVGTIKAVLDAVRLVTSLPRVVTMVAVDDRIAYPAVESFFEQFKGSGRDAWVVARDYLAKVFNVSISLPPVPKELARKFIAERLFADEFRKSPPVVERSSTAELEPSMPGPEFSDIPDGTALVTGREVDEFTRLALAIEMTNPRALWRMKQAWYLLRNMALTFDPDSAFEPWMRSMFVREAILGLSAEARRQIDAWADSVRKGHVPTLMSALIPPKVVTLLREDSSDVTKCWHYADIVLLPAAAGAAVE